MTKIDCGCGKYKREGYIGIDKMDFGQELILDLEVGDLPFKDNEVDEIYANHFVEHLKDTKHFFNEAWRVLKKGGLMCVNCPYCFWEGAQNPTHFQCITTFWFASLRDDNTVGFNNWEIKSLKEKANNLGQKFEIQAILTPEK